MCNAKTGNTDRLIINKLSQLDGNYIEYINVHCIRKRIHRVKIINFHLLSTKFIHKTFNMSKYIIKWMNQKS